MADTTVFFAAPSLRQPNTYSFVAPDPIPANATMGIFTINLQMADKLAVGKTITWRFETSPNASTWTRVTEGVWVSYGPGGLSYRDPRTGQQVTNPDPGLGVPLAGRAGLRLRGTAILNEALTAGVTIEIRTA